MYNDAVIDDAVADDAVADRDAEAHQKAMTDSAKPQIWKPRLESPLHHITHDPAPEKSTVTLEELPGMSHLILRGHSANPAFVSGAVAALGIDLPCKPCTCAHNNVLRIAWQSPDEWLIIAEPGQAGKIESALRHHLTGHFAVTDVSGGQTLMLLSGPNAQNVLKKSTLFDVDMQNFPIGSAVGTQFAKSQVFLRRTGEDAFELILRRSFADYLWQWLLDASDEYGVECRSKATPSLTTKS